MLVSLLRIFTVLCNMQHRRGLCQSRFYAAEHALPYLTFRHNSSWDNAWLPPNLSLIFFVHEVTGQITNQTTDQPTTQSPLREGLIGIPFSGCETYCWTMTVVLYNCSIKEDFFALNWYLFSAEGPDAVVSCWVLLIQIIAYLRLENVVRWVSGIWNHSDSFALAGVTRRSSSVKVARIVASQFYRHGKRDRGLVLR